MNSNRRGGAYGFKLESLDVLSEAKSTDKKITVLHYVASTVTVSKVTFTCLYRVSLNYFGTVGFALEQVSILQTCIKLQLDRTKFRE